MDLPTEPPTRIRGHTATTDPPDDEYPTSEVSVATEEVVLIGPDLRPPYPVRRGRQLRRSALRYFSAAILSPALRGEHRTGIRKALDIAALASYWLEGSGDFDTVHADLHRMGKFARENFPEDCQLHWDGKTYEHRCPVALAHKRFGFSVGLIVSKKTCSLCGQDSSECDHLPEHLYRVRGGSNGSPTGRCRVCAEEECTHDPAITFLTTPISVVEEIEALEEVSIVPNPKIPGARMAAIPVSTESLQSILGPDFRPSDRVQCSECLGECKGLTYLPNPGELTPPE